MSDMEPIIELHPQFSSEGATPTPWTEAREHLQKFVLFCNFFMQRPGVAFAKVCKLFHSDLERKERRDK